MILVRIMRKMNIFQSFYINHYIFTFILSLETCPLSVTLIKEEKSKKAETQINVSHLPQAPNKDRTKAALVPHPTLRWVHCAMPPARRTSVWEAEKRGLGCSKVMSMIKTLTLISESTLNLSLKLLS